MDVYATASTAITQIYQVTVFIQGIISDIKSFDDDRAQIRLKLQLQLATLHFFRSSFFDPQNGLMLPGKLPPSVSETVGELLMQMRKELAEYELLAVKYGLLGNEEEPKPQKKEDTAERGSLLERAKSKAKSLKQKGYDWSLFDKKKLQQIVDVYTEWSEGLRNLMQHMSQDSLARFMKEGDGDDGLKATGLEPVLKRQMLVDANAPHDFQSLEGELTEEGASSGGFRLGQWSHMDEKVQVVVEYHDYESILKRDDLEDEEIAEYKAPIQNLAWMLKNSTFSEGKTDTEGLDQPKIYALQCLGFIDQQEEERSVFIYKLPSLSGDGAVSDLTTLHAFINAIDHEKKIPLRKPSLNDRFSMAHCLALTLLNVHGSRWVHKNIWSRGILLFVEKDSGITPSGIKDRRGLTPNEAEGSMLAYLSDWGYARSVQQGTDMRSDFEVEPNLYRHPDRQGRPTHQFSRRHDIYALGVVLLEIGIWVTVSRFLDATIKDSKKSGRLPKAKKVAADLVGLARQGLPKEMDEGYATAVVNCLAGNFRSASDMELSLDFKKKVVDVLAQGIKL